MSLSPEDHHRVWRDYWAGASETLVETPAENLVERVVRRSGTIWEYLIEGRLELMRD
jgi:hypothetical protein